MAKQWFTVKTIGVKDIQDKFKGFIKRSSNFTVPFRIISLDIQAATFRHFAAQMGPEGKWLPFAMFRSGTRTNQLFKDKGIVQRRPSGAVVTSASKLLQDTGLLRNSIQTLRLEKLAVAVGTNLVYAGTHQFGNTRKNIPARPYLWLSESDVQRIVTTLSLHVMGRSSGTV